MWAIIINYKSVLVYLVRVLNQLYKLKQSEARRSCPHPPVSARGVNFFNTLSTISRRTGSHINTSSDPVPQRLEPTRNRFSYFLLTHLCDALLRDI